VVAGARTEGEGSRVFRGVRSYVKTSWTVFFGVSEVRRFLFANAAWEHLRRDAHVCRPLHHDRPRQPLSTSSACWQPSPSIRDRCARLVEARRAPRAARVILGASIVYGAGLLVAGLAQEWHNWYYGLIRPRRRRDG
jgi:hypothetical protein